MRTFIILVIFSWITGSTYSQDTLSNPKAILKFNPFELVSSTFMIGYEDIYNSGKRGLAFELGTTYANKAIYQDEQVIGVKGEITSKVYFGGFRQKVSKKNRNYLLGIYGGFFLRGGYERLRREYYTYDDGFDGESSVQYATRKGFWAFPGAMVGVSRTYWDYLLLDVYVGAGVRVVDLSGEDTVNDFFYYDHISPLDYSGVTPNIGIKIGLMIF